MDLQSYRVALVTFLKRVVFSDSVSFFILSAGYYSKSYRLMMGG